MQQLPQPTKLKGKLLLSTTEGILKGGKTGPLFKPGDATGSLMMERIHMPQDEKKHMPPKGKTQLTADEISLLSWWIDEQGGFDKKVVDLNQTDEVKSIISKYVSYDKNVMALNVAPATEKVIQNLRSYGIEINQVAIDKPFFARQSQWTKGFESKNYEAAQAYFASVSFP